ncbi:class I SAM-dependent methyltransferase [Ramlibacter sp. PS4R-6]|uniref:class I SAM-dependent methyltransferase n=1 Tax=Ramlibacter sp. PS4R-6 TaxID=3133438 RepID=UPI00309E00A4
MSVERESWGSGDAYERWMGRWSRPLARLFLEWLAVPAQREWADVGCGTGALVQAILDQCAPGRVAGADRSAAYVEDATRRIADPRASFVEADAQQLPWPDASFDAVVSGLVLNFVPSAQRMAAEMARVARPGAVVAAYVWDYSGGMKMVRSFWDAAIELRGGDTAMDQAERFPICRPDALESLFVETGLEDVASRPLDFTMVFRDFDDYWLPFLGRQGSAPTYLASLDEKDQGRIRELLRDRLRPAADGSIALPARAWAVRGRRGL